MLVNPKAGIYETVGHCKVADCGKAMLSKHAWTAGVRRPDHVSAGGHGMCRIHYQRWTRHGSTEKQVAKGKGGGGRKMGRAEMLEEYMIIRESCSSVAHAARRMGITFAALDKALYRARKDGIAGALPPPNQIDRAIERGQADYLRSAA